MNLRAALASTSSVLQGPGMYHHNRFTVSSSNAGVFGISALSLSTIKLCSV